MSVYFAFRLSRASPFLLGLCHCAVSKLLALFSLRQFFLLPPCFQMQIQGCPGVFHPPSGIICPLLCRLEGEFFNLLLCLGEQAFQRPLRGRVLISRADTHQKLLTFQKLLLCFKNPKETYCCVPQRLIAPRECDPVLSEREECRAFVSLLPASPHSSPASCLLPGPSQHSLAHPSGDTHPPWEGVKPSHYQLTEVGGLGHLK